LTMGIRELITTLGSRTPVFVRRFINAVDPVRHLCRGLVSLGSDAVLRYDSDLKLVVHPIMRVWYSFYGTDPDSYERVPREELRPLVRRGGVAWDVGANVGLYAMLMAKWVGPEGRVVAFEPDPVNFSYLRKNAAANGFENMICVPTALSDRSGRARFEAEHGPIGRVIFPGNRPRGRVISVDLATGDGLVLEDGLPRPDVVKIDVEGHEVNVIRGMMQILQEAAPSLWIEVHSASALDELSRILTSCGYRLARSFGSRKRTPPIRRRHPTFSGWLIAVAERRARK